MRVFYKCDEWSFADAVAWDFDAWCDENERGRQAWMTPAVRADMRRRLDETGVCIGHGFMLSTTRDGLRRGFR